MSTMRHQQKKQQKQHRLPTTVDWWKHLPGVAVSRSQTVAPHEGSGRSSQGDSQTASDTEADATVDDPTLATTMPTVPMKIEADMSPKKTNRDKSGYEAICERKGAVTSRRLVEVLRKKTSSHEDDRGIVVSLRHYGMREDGLQAVSKSISVLGGCSSLDLEANILTARTLSSLCRMLVDNSQINHLNLCGCGISGFGPIILGPFLSVTKILRTLLLRDNEFNDEDGRILFECLASNRSLKKLDLSKNRFFLRCARELETMIEDNDILEELDLSWNQIRMSTAAGIAKGLRKNTSLRELRLAWNGLGDSGAVDMGDSLRENESLGLLDLAFNRIADKGLAGLMGGLAGSVVHTLVLGGNFVRQSAVEAVLHELADPASSLATCKLTTIDLKSSIFRPSIEEVAAKTRKTRPEFRCLHGYESQYGERPLRAYNMVSEALQTVQNHILQSGITLAELFETLDDNGAPSVSYEVFRAGLKGARIPISDTQIDQLIQYLDSDGDGEIDFSELVIGTEKTVDSDPQPRVSSTSQSPLFQAVNNAPSDQIQSTTDIAAQ